jgi:hypothetical protein
MMTCPKCSNPVAPDKAVIADETVYECKTCHRFTVQGGAEWVADGPYLITELRLLAESRDRSVKGS